MYVDRHVKCSAKFCAVKLYSYSFIRCRVVTCVRTDRQADFNRPSTGVLVFLNSLEQSDDQSLLTASIAKGPASELIPSNPDAIVWPVYGLCIRS